MPRCATLLDIAQHHRNLHPLTHVPSTPYSRISFFFAFFAWFAFAPLMTVIGPQLNLTEKEAWIANIVSVVSTIFMRFIIGPMCDTYGARRLQVRTSLGHAPSTRARTH